MPSQHNTTMALTTIGDKLVSPTSMPQINTTINFKPRFINQNETSIGKIRGDTFAGFSTLTTLANSKQLKKLNKERNSVGLTSYFRSTAPGFVEPTSIRPSAAASV